MIFNIIISDSDDCGIHLYRIVYKKMQTKAFVVIVQGVSRIKKQLFSWNIQIKIKNS